MPNKNGSAVKLSLGEQIEELKQKQALLDGDRKAFHENAEWTKKKNQEKVEQLRKENKDLRLKLKDLLAVIYFFCDTSYIYFGFE